MNAYREPADMPPEPPEPQPPRKPWWTKEKEGYAILASTALLVGVFAAVEEHLKEYLCVLGVVAVVGAIVTGVIFVLDGFDARTR